jgi:hypothetical protein
MGDEMTRPHTAALLTGLCIALSGCEAGSTRDITAPGPGSGRGTTAGEAQDHVAIRANGEIVSAPARRALARLRQPDARRSTPPVASAVAPTLCDAGFLDPEDGLPEGGLDGGTYSDVEVPAGAICVLQGAEVTNSVRALAGARLFIRGTLIGGDVEGLGASSVQVSDETTISGDMTVLNADDTFFASCSVDNATILGDLTCQGNDPGSPVIRAEQGPTVIGGSVNLVDNAIPTNHVLLLLNADIGDDADVSDNTGPGFKGVSGNTVADKLQCKRNDATFSGGPNTAGKAKGDCF